jgi:hypothetical protein
MISRGQQTEANIRRTVKISVANAALVTTENETTTQNKKVTQYENTQNVVKHWCYPRRGGGLQHDQGEREHALGGGFPNGAS